jgi:hypothetical protein
MYLLRRVYKTQPGKAWEVAANLTKVLEAYESAGRNKAQVYISGVGLPGTPDVVYAEWTQDKLEPTDATKVPEDVKTYSRKFLPMVDEHTIELYELVTPEKLQARGLP